jgi:DNA-binding NarL/FixJ family response regulator
VRPDAPLRRLRPVPDPIVPRDRRGSDRIGVRITAADPVSQAGIDGQLRYRPEVRLLPDDARSEADVTIIVADEVDDEALSMIRAPQRNGGSRVVLVAARLDDGGLLAAVEAGVCGLVRRSEATPERLVAVVRAALAGDGSMPPDLLGRLLDQVGSLQRQLLEPRGLSFNGLTHREVQVLGLVADGFSTREIAERLAYSERTIKNVIHDLTTRLQLRNRAHAVAYAVRRGLI